MARNLILTESQFKACLANEKMEILSEAFLDESVDTKDLRRKIKSLIAAGVTIAAITAAISKIGLDERERIELEQLAQAEALHKADSVFQRKVDAVSKYMNMALKNQGYTANSTQLKPETLVRVADEYNFDLPFLLAVAHQESCFGAGNRAKRTGSVFSVGCHDNGRNLAHYSDPNDSVGSYIRLLQNDYLTNGKTINDLLQKGGFVNKMGNRYASDKNYEAKIKNLRNKIIREYPELG